MHYKRRRPKSTRAGRLFFKPHKRQGTSRKERQRPRDARELEDDIRHGKVVVYEDQLWPDPHPDEDLYHYDPNLSDLFEA